MPSQALCAILVFIFARQSSPSPAHLPFSPATAGMATNSTSNNIANSFFMD
jgi:hypothetical protein